MNSILEEKYYRLLLKRCLKIEKSLFISTNSICLKYAEKVVKMAKEMGIEDIYLNIVDSNEVKMHLNNTNIEDFDNDPFFDTSIWNTYAKKHAAFLMLKTELPGVMDDCDKDKIMKMASTQAKYMREYKELQLKYIISWTIAVLPNKIWADKLFPNVSNNEELLFDYICKMTMVDLNTDPIDNWNKQIERNSIMVEKLNNLNIKSLTYKGTNGTDITVGFTDRRIWKGTKKGDFIVNMPSYEIFTTPCNKLIDGIVYSTKPLMYNGTLIDKFSLEFKNGRVVNSKAEVGDLALKLLIESVPNANSLGEVALVSDDSPISKTNINFGNTLFDENASCHFALGNGFPLCVNGYDELNEEEIENLGFNKSLIHVDFMVGGSMIDIYAKTFDGKEIKIMEKGLFII